MRLRHHGSRVAAGPPRGRRSAATGVLAACFALAGGAGWAGSFDPCASPGSVAPCDDGNACTQSDRCAAGACVGAAPFLIAERARLGNGGELEADLTVNAPDGRLSFGRRAHAADGTLAVADRLRLGVGADVAHVAFNSVNGGAGRAVVRGAAASPITLPLVDPFCTLPPLDCGGPDVEVGRRQTLDLLAPGSYGTLTVQNGGTITLAPGAFAFCAIRAGRGATITALASVPASPTTIDVQQDVALGNDGALGPGPGNPLPALNVGGAHVRFSHGSDVAARLTAPGARVKLGRGATMTGTVCAAALFANRGAILGCTAACGDALVDPGEGCDDGNAEDGDGCSDACLVECGSTVCAPGEICLGDQCLGVAP